MNLGEICANRRSVKSTEMIFPVIERKQYTLGNYFVGRHTSHHVRPRNLI